MRAGRPGGQVAEFKAMVDALHAAGIEVILDVVFNHSAEAGHMGPTLSFRGLDNPAYYRLEPGDPSRYVDTTGCGNSLNAGDLPGHLPRWVRRPRPGGGRHPLMDDDFLVLFNAWWESLDFVIPETRAGLEWRAEIDSYDPAAPAAAPPRHAG